MKTARSIADKRTHSYFSNERTKSTKQRTRREECILADLELPEGMQIIETRPRDSKLKPGRHHEDLWWLCSSRP